MELLIQIILTQKDILTQQNYFITIVQEDIIQKIQMILMKMY